MTPPTATATNGPHGIALTAFRPNPPEMLGEHDGGRQHSEADRGPFQNNVGAFGRE